MFGMRWKVNSSVEIILSTESSPIVDSVESNILRSQLETHLDKVRHLPEVVGLDHEVHAQRNAAVYHVGDVTHEDVPIAASTVDKVGLLASGVYGDLHVVDSLTRSLNPLKVSGSEEGSVGGERKTQFGMTFGGFQLGNEIPKER
jgi:hypothetical protein